MPSTSEIIAFLFHGTWQCIHMQKVHLLVSGIDAQGSSVPAIQCRLQTMKMKTDDVVQHTFKGKKFQDWWRPRFEWRATHVTVPQVLFVSHLKTSKLNQAFPEINNSDHVHLTSPL